MYPIPLLTEESSGVSSGACSLEPCMLATCRINCYFCDYFEYCSLNNILSKKQCIFLFVNRGWNCQEAAIVLQVWNQQENRRQREADHKQAM